MAPARALLPRHHWKAKGIVKNVKDGIKILGDGDLKHALTVRANKFSKSAVEKIQKAGGVTEVVSL